MEEIHNLEFHVHAKGSRKFRGTMFGLGSLIAALFAGIALGATLLGFPMSKENAQGITSASDPFANTIPHFSDNALSFVHAFSIWAGIGALIAGGLRVSKVYQQKPSQGRKALFCCSRRMVRGDFD